MTDVVEMVFGTEGILSQHFDGYAPRVGQVDMARSVDEAILCDRRIAIEAPTGTGKSLAYLVPAIAYAAQQRRRVIVATANIALQEQLVNKDLPFLQNILPYKFTYALAKGRSNYVCRRENAEIRKADLEAWQIEEVDAVREWIAETRTGDWSEVTWEIPWQVKKLFTIEYDECPGKSRCKYGEDCFAEYAKAKVAAADVVVTNYHLLMAHLALTAQLAPLGRVSPILPPLDILICDESHKMADIARDFFGLRLTEGGMRRLARYLPHTESAGFFKAELAARLGMLFSAIGKVVDDHKPRIRSSLGVPVESHAQRVVEKLTELGGFYRRQAAAEREYVHNSDGEEVEKENEWDFRAERCAKAIHTLGVLLQHGVEDGLVRFIGTTSGKNLSLEAKPVNVGPYLDAELFKKARSVIMTSATLSVGNSLSHFASDVGARDYDALIVASPFNFQEQCALVVCPEAPDPNDPTFIAYVCEKLQAVVAAAGGRTLALFTSYRILDACHEYLVRQKLPFKVLRQGVGERSRLLAEFKKDVTSVLLGTESFWAGVDVQGEALSAVLIDKLPFPNMNDPILDAIRERNPDGWFLDDALPRAVIQFKQGFGRLIRTTDDRGVVVICDPRIVRKRYGKQFIASLPRLPVSENAREAIEKQLGRQPSQLLLV